MVQPAEEDHPRPKEIAKAQEHIESVGRWYQSEYSPLEGKYDKLVAAIGEQARGAASGTDTGKHGEVSGLEEELDWSKSTPEYIGEHARWMIARWKPRRKPVDGL